MIVAFAQQLRDAHEPIVQRWMSAVRADPKLTTANGLAEKELRDHLGSLVLRLAETLNASAQQPPEVEPEVSPATPRDARKHGQSRWAQHYRVDELVREISVLRYEMLEIFRDFIKSRGKIETEEFLQTTQVVHRFFDEICMDSVAVYVSEREEQAALTHQGLRRLNEAMEKEYESADVSRRRTLSTVAHEMATPVNALGLGVTYLAESDDPEERREAKQLISRTLEHLRVMLDQLLDFARTDGGGEKVRVARFEVRPLFEYLTAGFEPMAGAREIEFHGELDESLVSVCSDENKVQRIAVNLLSNAVKYTETGCISLALRAVSDTHWAIEVTDTGCGIPEEDLARIFAEFQRLAIHSEKPGLGLGLAIVRNLAERLGGEVKVESKVGQGSRFTVVLPREI
jgi:signal transduction histidine kinase